MLTILLYVAKFFAVFGFGAAALTAQSAAQELKFQGPVKLYVGFAAGGQSDILARVMADKLKDRIGRAVVVENKTGAAGRLAVEAVKSAPPDGSAFVLANIAQMSVAPLIYKDLPYDPLNDFTAIGKVADFQIALVTGKQTGAGDWSQTLAWLRANPTKATSGNPGSGSLPHLYGFELASAIGVRLEPIPYRGGAPIVTAIAQGELAIGWASVTDFIEQHRAGQVRIIAVTGASRSPQLPDVPTFTELSIPAVSENGWIGMFGPAGLPPDVAALFVREVSAVLADSAVRQRLESLGLIVAPGTPSAMMDRIRAELARWKPVVDKAEIKP